ncbi:MAG: fatty acid desaturase [Gloeobacteraceae cyanobacterium ES-bin-144]|nr:fatty acid desaturase [Verrucomicrobiales bacterium]
MQSLNKKFLPLVWLESLGALLLHGSLILWWDIPVWHWFAVLCGFGIMWSAMQYVHHFGTSRDVMNGAVNLRTWRWLDVLWLNHNWHLRHHQQPTVPWIYLPFLEAGETETRGHILAAYWKMWRGPRFTMERVKNRYAGKIIR